jgi:hypothetical protein
MLLSIHPDRKTRRDLAILKESSDKLPSNGVRIVDSNPGCLISSRVAT